MFAYLLFVLFAYYILKPVSQAMFLNKFDVDDLPFLIILIAIGGGSLAYAYSRVAVKTSLPHAVSGTMITAVACLVPSGGCSGSTCRGCCTCSTSSSACSTSCW